MIVDCCCPLPSESVIYFGLFYSFATTVLYMFVVFFFFPNHVFIITLHDDQLSWLDITPLRAIQSHLSCFFFWWPSTHKPDFYSYKFHSSIRAWICHVHSIDCMPNDWSEMKESEHMSNWPKVNTWGYHMIWEKDLLSVWEREGKWASGAHSHKHTHTHMQSTSNVWNAIEKILIDENGEKSHFRKCLFNAPYYILFYFILFICI